MKPEHQLNEQIREKEIRLIASDGEQKGVTPTSQALEMAISQNLDLVMISPTAVPPVCKIMDYGKFKFETMKKAKETKKNQKVVELKEVWLSATIDTNDLNTKAKSAIKFLKDGNRVRASIRMKGRQMAHPEIAIKVMDDFTQIVGDVGLVEKRPLLEGRSIAMILVPSVKK